MARKRTPIAATEPEVQNAQQPPEGGEALTAAHEATHTPSLRARRRQRRASLDDEEPVARFHEDEDEDDEDDEESLDEDLFDDEDEEEPEPSLRPRRRRQASFLDEEDEDENDEEDEEPESPPNFPVANTHPELLAFLTALPDPATVLALIDWLMEQGDPRADHVRELSEARCVIPEGICYPLRAQPMACGRWWTITRQNRSVTGHAYRGTLLHRVLTGVTYRGEVQARAPRREQTPEGLRAAFERCRRGLLLGFFGTSVQHLRARQSILSEPRLDRLDKVLARCNQTAVPWLVELRAADRARFDRIVERIWTTPALHGVGYALLDAVDPGWRTRLPS
jgi:hypothetical protein